MGTDGKKEGVKAAIIGCIVVAAALVGVVGFSSGGPGFAWSLELTSPLAGDPAAAEGLVVFCTEDKVVQAHDGKTGKELWRYGDAQAYGSPLIAGERIFVRTLDKEILALGRSTGEKLWTCQNKGFPGRPALASELILFGYGFSVLGLDQESGEKTWAVRTRGRHRPERITVAGKVAYLGYKVDSNYTLSFGGRDAVGGGVYAIDIASEEILWHADLKARVESPPVVTPDRVVVTTRSGLVNSLYCLDRETGDQKWKYLGAESWPVVTGQVVCLEGSDMKRNGPVMQTWTFFAGVDLATGEELWTASHGGDGVYAIAARGEQVIFGLKESIRALGSSGWGSWSLGLGAELDDGPVIDGDMMLVSTKSPALRAFCFD